jgi:hypothetical protein
MNPKNDVPELATRLSPEEQTRIQEALERGQGLEQLQKLRHAERQQLLREQAMQRLQQLVEAPARQSFPPNLLPLPPLPSDLNSIRTQAQSRARSDESVAALPAASRAEQSVAAPALPNRFAHNRFATLPQEIPQNNPLLCNDCGEQSINAVFDCSHAICNECYSSNKFACPVCNLNKQPQLLSGGGSNYKEKYLKYKNKYLQLKSLL